MHKHKLSKCQVIHFKDSDFDMHDANLTENVTVENASSHEEEPQRFVKTTEEEIDEIATHTKAKTTHQQMKWGVKILKGNICM